jgi:hypothetical protein
MCIDHQLYTSSRPRPPNKDACWCQVAMPSVVLNDVGCVMNEEQRSNTAVGCVDQGDPSLCPTQQANPNPTQISAG